MLFKILCHALPCAVVKLFLRLIFIALVLGASGCASLKKLLHLKPAPRAERTHPAPERVGVIVLVNDDAHFVLIDTTTGVIPDSGTALKALRNDAEIAVLHSGAIQRRPFVIADIVSGAPARGDTVFR